MNNKVEYIRTTHDFDNTTRTWNYRGDVGGDKVYDWHFDNLKKFNCPRYSLGVHVLSSWLWMDLDWVVEETIFGYLYGAVDNPEDLQNLINTNPNFKNIVRRDVFEELEYLISIDMVKRRDI